MRARRRFVMTALATTATLVATALPAVVAVAPAASPPAPGLTVSVDTRATPGPTVPNDFIGLSLEATTLASPLLEPATSGNLIGLLRSLGPGVLRFGGDSVDRDVSWETQASLLGQKPTWSTVMLHPTDFQRLRRFLDATGWKAIVGLNLGHFDPGAAAAEANAAVAALGPDLVSLEIGNEPNAYTTNHRRDASWGAADYEQEITQYRDRIRAILPNVQLTGPGSYPPTFLDAWGQVMGGQGTELTEHLYPLNACSTATPTVEQLLSHQTTRREAQLVASGIASATASGLRLRLGEANSVICSGFYGVSDVFASALWVSDFLAIAAQGGVVGVNLHSAFKQCPDQFGTAGKGPYYSVVCATTADDLSAGRFRAQPSWYGLQLVSVLRGTSFLPVTVKGHQSSTSSAYSTIAPDGTVRVLVVDESTNTSDAAHSVSIQLDPRYGEATMVKLTGPSPYLPSQVRLQGAAVAPDGSLTPGAPSVVSGRSGVFTAKLAPGSAAMFTITPACSVPDLKGLTQSSATTVLARNGCTVGVVSRVKQKKPGKVRYVVLRQHVKAGSVQTARSPISFTIAPAPAPKKKAKVTR